ncbi:hypothetical protein Zmor_006350 [Zophobas morio]|uniref:Uncharacterized protein n=1 Tax=Zophobas morio TaxID=2755281 RepID=A0AA38IRJ0_9CUCU|nr:hypothetical protein Zmor_006350 [Zophobas morio]
MARNIKSNPADLWKFQSQRRGTSRIPNTVFKDSCTFSRPLDVVNGIANHFSTTYVADIAMDLSNLTSNILPLNFVSVQEQQLINIMAKFSNKFTAGDDLIPSFLIRDCRYVLAIMESAP